MSCDDPLKLCLACTQRICRGRCACTCRSAASNRINKLSAPRLDKTV